MKEKLKKIVVLGVFLTIIFSNLKIYSANVVENGAISLFGYEIVLFEATHAKPVDPATCDDLCTSKPDHFCTYIVSVGHCWGYWR